MTHTKPDFTSTVMDVVTGQEPRPCAIPSLHGKIQEHGRLVESIHSRRNTHVQPTVKGQVHLGLHWRHIKGFAGKIPYEII